ncbi:imelysin family protein [Salinimicrobium sp. HB62]|uniref:imelysin family protein n=1 Tax=Salinimicrobium sp. HB62 TaxID=3077781 RepID=UPI002D796CAC|nr:imelysin family protein [Salinimicrobium sp. HB62]
MFKKIKLLVLAAFIVACNSDDSGKSGNTDTDNFDRGAMLENWADNIIIPSFENFSGKTASLEEAAVNFAEDPSEGNLAILRAAFEEAYLEYQTVAPFEIGEAEALDYHGFLNIYPADAAAITAKAEANSFNLELPGSRDEQGFPALDYLINGLGETDTEIVSFYTSENENSEGYKNYLTAVTARINALTNAVLADWKNSYRDIFVNNTSSSSTGSVDKFTNDFVMYFEMDLRSGKIGIPAGAFSGNPAPETAEAYYSEDLSKQLYLKAFETFRNFFNGKHFNSSQTGPSYKQYLEYLHSIRGGENIAALINEQMADVVQQADALQSNLAEQVRTDKDVMLAAFDELQKLVVLLKIDMLQALDISVDYVDTDGD